MNNSTSTNLPASRTRWPQDSFRPLPTLLLFLVVVVPVVGLGVYQGIATLEAHIDPSAYSNPIFVIWSIALTMLGEGLLVLLLLAFLPRVSGLSFRSLGYRLPSRRDLLVASLGAIVMAIVADGGAALIESTLHLKHDQTTVVMLKQMHDPRLLAAFAFFACVFAPFAEETIFRVFLFNAARRYGGLIFGAIASAVCFGLAHGDPVAGVPLMCAGIVLVFVYYTTNNAFSSMLTHGLFNSLTFLAIILFPTLAQ